MIEKVEQLLRNQLESEIKDIDMVDEELERQMNILRHEIVTEYLERCIEHKGE